MPRHKKGYLPFAKKGAGEIMYILNTTASSASQLADATGLSYPTVMKRIEELEMGGCAEETEVVSKSDKGADGYKLSVKGFEIARALFPDLEEKPKKPKAGR